MVRLDASSAETSPVTGYIKVFGQVGIVGTLVYGEVDGAPFDGWTELVPPETLFDEVALDTLINAPVTLQHPPVFLDASNTKEFSIGSIIELDPRPNEGPGILLARHLITDDEAIAEVRSGTTVELSLGYTARVGGDPGVFNGTKYDAVQFERRYNHNAIVTEARAGPTNVLDRVDAYRRLARIFKADGLRIQSISINTGARQVPAAKRNKKNDAEITIGDASFTVDQEVHDAFSAQAAMIDELQSKDKGDEADEEEGKDAKDEDAKDAKDAEGDDEEEEESREGKSDDKPLTRADVATMLAHGQAATVKAVLSGLDRRDAKVKQDAAQLALVVAQAKPMLHASFRVDGKTPAAIMLAAVTQSAPALKATMEGAATAGDMGQMRGIFQAARITLGHTADGKKPTLDNGEGGKKEDGLLAVAQKKRDAKNEAARHQVPFENGQPVSLTKAAELRAAK